MKLFSIVLLLPLYMAAYGQTHDTIKVQKQKWSVQVSSADSVFWVGKENRVKIDVKGGSNYRINIRGATIAKQPEGYVVYAKEPGAAAITVYELLPQKKMRVLCTKLFTIREIPRVQLFLCGVKADSVIDKRQIINDNILTAYHPYYKKQLQVIGFDMLVSAGDTTQRLSSLSNRFTIDMRRRIYYLKSGSLLYLENVWYVLPDGTLEKSDSFEVFISDSNKYNVGFRVAGL